MISRAVTSDHTPPTSEPALLEPPAQFEQRSPERRVEIEVVPVGDIEAQPVPSDSYIRVLRRSEFSRRRCCPGKMIIQHPKSTGVSFDVEAEPFNEIPSSHKDLWLDRHKTFPWSAKLSIPGC